ncbi:MAG TPA: STAS/SEC14 domain-containing protein [Gammaproteobacteria bacterium]|nr:STAS/SEC14 domain-containing protein [Gammaproteobacteria bacterium]
MLERVEGLPSGVYGLRASGKVSKEDYDRVVVPLLEEAQRDGRRIRLLYHFTPEFTGFTAGGAWEDAEIGFKYLRVIERCAVVTDRDWIRSTARVVAAVLPCPVKIFREEDLSEALAWLSAASSQTARLEHRLIPERGVLVVEPHGRLTVEDFDAVAATVDPWIESGRELYGIVLHAREFPGWESVGSFVRHVQFVRDHHRKVRRVALSADGKLAKLAPALVENFVGAEIRHFPFEELDRAIEWASRPGVPSEPAPTPSP